MKLTVSREGVTFEAADKEFVLSNPQNRKDLMELVANLHSAATKAKQDEMELEVSASQRRRALPRP